MGAVLLALLLALLWSAVAGATTRSSFPPAGQAGSVPASIGADEKRSLLEGRLPLAGLSENPRVSVGLLNGSELPASVDTASLGVRFLRAVPSLQIVVLEVLPEPPGLPRTGLQEQYSPSPDRVASVLAALRTTEGVAWAEQEGSSEVEVVPNDTNYSYQWALPRVRLPEAWDLTQGSSAVTLAILDTGIEPGIPDFAGRIVSPYSAYYDSTLPLAWLDIQGHGSGVAAVAAATGNDSYGVAGAAWNVRIMPVHLSDTGVSSDSDFAVGVAWAVDHGADVINFSAGGADTQTKRAAVNYALSRGVSIVAAAGNDGPGVGLILSCRLHGCHRGGGDRLERQPGQLLADRVPARPRRAGPGHRYLDA